jgi:hypothetical protein
MFTPDPDLDFFTHPGSQLQGAGIKKVPDSGSATLTNSTVEAEPT